MLKLLPTCTNATAGGHCHGWSTFGSYANVSLTKFACTSRVPLVPLDALQPRPSTLYLFCNVIADGTAAGPAAQSIFGQLVPQLMIGNVEVCGGHNNNHSAAGPVSHRNSSTWLAQAQYYWTEVNDGGKRCVGGAVFDVSPGDAVAMTTALLPNGSVSVRVASGKHHSAIVVDHPQLDPAQSWSKFWRGGLLRPYAAYEAWDAPATRSAAYSAGEWSVNLTSIGGDAPVAFHPWDAASPSTGVVVEPVSKTAATWRWRGRDRDRDGALAALALPSAYAPHREHCPSGFWLYASGLNISFCNNTAWTFRDVHWLSPANDTLQPVLSATGFAQCVSNVRVGPNASRAKWPPLRRISPFTSVIKRGPNGPPAPGAPGGSGFLGTGHGGEYVFALNLLAAVATPPRSSGRASWPLHAINLLADARLPVAQTWSPDTPLTVVKDSQIGPFLVVESVTLRRGPQGLGRLRIHVNLTVAFPDVVDDVDFLYPAMTMFAEPFTHWYAVLANGTRRAGTFTSDYSFTLRSDIMWLAVHSAEESRGALYQYPGQYHGSARFKNSFWNRQGDHKLYFRVDPPNGTVGSSVEYIHEIVPFSVPPGGNWTAIAQSLVVGW
tara:strand:- start:10 stop:1830 length:1821 start_codon:yes stop_codon:yes gene_type:complete